jgi:hypothetical protein
MAWDNIRMAEKFLKRANAIRPEDESGAARDQETARQDLYYECYMMSFSESKVGEALNTFAEGTVKIPEDVRADVYRQSFMEEAKVAIEWLAAGAK